MFDPRTHLAPQFGDEIVHVQTLGTENALARLLRGNGMLLASASVLTDRFAGIHRSVLLY